MCILFHLSFQMCEMKLVHTKRLVQPGLTVCRGAPVYVLKLFRRRFFGCCKTFFYSVCLCDKISGGVWCNIYNVIIIFIVPGHGDWIPKFQC
jgi:hypothetical protein